MKPWTPEEVLAQLVREEALSTWLQRQPEDISAHLRLGAPDRGDGTRQDKRAQALIAAVRELPAPQRQRLADALLHAAQLASPAGFKAMTNAAMNRPEVYRGLMQHDSALQCSFWLHVHHPEVFELACADECLDENRLRSHQYGLAAGAMPATEPAALQALCDELGGYLRRYYGFEGQAHASLCERTPGVYLLGVELKQLPAALGGALSLSLEHAPHTGAVRTLVDGNADMHRRLVAAFARHLLGAPVEPERLWPTPYDLTVFRQALPSCPGFDGDPTRLQLRALRFASPDESSTLCFELTGDDDLQQANALVSEQLPHNDPLAERWRIIGASLMLHHPPMAGQTFRPAVRVVLTSGGQSNLHRFDPALQANIEGHLVRLGVLQPAQTLRTSLSSATVERERDTA